MAEIDRELARAMAGVASQKPEPETKEGAIPTEYARGIASGFASAEYSPPGPKASDLGYSALKGFLNIASGIAYGLGENLGIEKAKEINAELHELQNWYEQHQSTSYKGAQIFGPEGSGELWGKDAHWAIAAAVIESAPFMMLTMPLGGALTKALGATTKLSKTAAAVTGAGAGEGILGGLINAYETFVEVQKIPMNVLEKQEQFQAALAQIPEDLPESQRKEAARLAVARAAARTVQYVTTGATALFGAPASHAFGKIMAGESGHNFLTTMAKQVFLEGVVQEAPQSIAEVVAQRQVLMPLDPSLKQVTPYELATTAGTGALVGGIMGGTMAPLAHIQGRANRDAQALLNELQQSPGQAPPPGAGGLEDIINEVAGVTPGQDPVEMTKSAFEALAGGQIAPEEFGAIVSDLTAQYPDRAAEIAAAAGLEVPEQAGEQPGEPPPGAALPPETTAGPDVFPPGGPPVGTEGGRGPEAAEEAEDQILATKKALYQALKDTGAPDDVAANAVMGWQEKTNERGEPMNVWRGEAGQLALMPASSKPPLSNGELLGTLYPEAKTPPVEPTEELSPYERAAQLAAEQGWTRQTQEDLERNRPELTSDDDIELAMQAIERQIDEVDKKYGKPKEVPPQAFPQIDSALDYLRKSKGAGAERRGVSLDEALSDGIIGMEEYGGKGGLHLFTKGGMSFDAAAELLNEAGYPNKYGATQGDIWDPNSVAQLLSAEKDLEMRDRTHTGPGYERFLARQGLEREIDYLKGVKEEAEAEITARTEEADRLVSSKEYTDIRDAIEEAFETGQPPLIPFSRLFDNTDIVGPIDATQEEETLLAMALYAYEFDPEATQRAMEATHAEQAVRELMDIINRGRRESQDETQEPTAEEPAAEPGEPDSTDTTAGPREPPGNPVGEDAGSVERPEGGGDTGRGEGPPPAAETTAGPREPEGQVEAPPQEEAAAEPAPEPDAPEAAPDDPPPQTPRNEPKAPTKDTDVPGILKRVGGRLLRGLTKDRVDDLIAAGELADKWALDSALDGVEATSTMSPKQQSDLLAVYDMLIRPRIQGLLDGASPEELGVVQTDPAVVDLASYTPETDSQLFSADWWRKLLKAAANAQRAAEKAERDAKLKKATRSAIANGIRRHRKERAKAKLQMTREWARNYRLGFWSAVVDRARRSNVKGGEGVGVGFSDGIKFMQDNVDLLTRTRSTDQAAETGEKVARQQDIERQLKDAAKGKFQLFAETLERATRSSNVIKPSLHEDATPGAARVVSALRRKTKSFREFVDSYLGHDFTNYYTGGFAERIRKYHTDLTDLANTPAEEAAIDAQLRELLLDLADRYRKAHSAFGDSMDGAGMVSSVIRAVRNNLLTGGAKSSYYSDFDTTINWADQVSEVPNRWTRWELSAEGKAALEWTGEQRIAWRREAEEKYPNLGDTHISTGAAPVGKSGDTKSDPRALLTRNSQEDFERDELVETGANKPKAIPHRPRVGIPEFDGKTSFNEHPKYAATDVPAEALEEFGFAGISVGSYTGAAGQRLIDHVNMTYHSLHDMANVLGVDPKSLSFGGTLHLTVGRLGQGFVTSGASAFFSDAYPFISTDELQKSIEAIRSSDNPADELVRTQSAVARVPVINIVNKHGDGSLAHEMHHAVEFRVRAANDADGASMVDTLQNFLQYRAVTDLQQISGEIKTWLEDAVKVDTNTGDILIEYKYMPAFSVNIPELAAQYGEDMNGSYFGGGLQEIHGSMPDFEERLKARTEQIERWASMISKLGDAWLNKDKHGYSGATRAEIAQAMLEAFSLKTEYLKSAEYMDALEGKTNNPYWSNRKELLARSSEAFVADRLEEEGIVNTYLVNNAYTKKEGRDPSVYRTWDVYPEGDERAFMNSIWKAFYQNITFALDGWKVSEGWDLPPVNDFASALANGAGKAQLDVVFKAFTDKVVDIRKNREAELKKQREEQERKLQEEQDAWEDAFEDGEPPPEEQIVNDPRLKDLESLTDQDIDDIFDEALGDDGVKEHERDSTEAVGGPDAPNVGGRKGGGRSAGGRAGQGGAGSESGPDVGSSGGRGPRAAGDGRKKSQRGGAGEAAGPESGPEVAGEDGGREGAGGDAAAERTRVDERDRRRVREKIKEGLGGELSDDIAGALDDLLNATPKHATKERGPDGAIEAMAALAGFTEEEYQAWRPKAARTMRLLMLEKGMDARAALLMVAKAFGQSGFDVRLAAKRLLKDFMEGKVPELNMVAAEDQSATENEREKIRDTKRDDAEKQQAKVDKAKSRIRDAFSDYQPTEDTRKAFPTAKEHPTPLVESVAMAAVPLPEVDYKVSDLTQDGRWVGSEKDGWNFIKGKFNPVETGDLSIAQLEFPRYAGAIHERFDSNGIRQGIMGGDGTGVGKGRGLSAVIMDNVKRGRTKALWLSAKADDLFNDAKRDWAGIGGNPNDLQQITEKQASEGKALFPADPKKVGIRYATYSALGAKNFSLGQQLVAELGKDFDGVIVFDETHMLGGLKEGGELTKRATGGIRLQQELPKARIVYMSATGATDVRNFVYAERLGLWGPDLPFQDHKKFMEDMTAASENGIGSLELIAASLKSSGRYVARRLSFVGHSKEESMEHETMSAPFSTASKADWDSAIENWGTIYNEVKRLTQVMVNNPGAYTTLSPEAMMQAHLVNVQKVMKVWRGTKISTMAFMRQSFFKEFLTAIKALAIIEDVKRRGQWSEAEKKFMDKSFRFVVQLTATQDAAQQRIIKNARDAAKDDGSIDFDALDLSELTTDYTQIAKDFIENHLPVKGLVIVPNGLDSQGKPKFKAVNNTDPDASDKAEIVRVKTMLAGLADSFKPYGNPIDNIIAAFPGEVAEITGRASRIEDGKNVNRSPALRSNEARDFQRGKRNILVFSEAGGTGLSYHDDKTIDAVLSARRVHYVLQPGWRADTTLQGLGRTHRSNQYTAPIVVLVKSDVRAEQRFIGAVSRRLASMGALTGGSREAGGSGVLESDFSLMDKYAREGWRAMFAGRQYADLFRNTPLEGVTLPDGSKISGSVIEDMTNMAIYTERTSELAKSQRDPEKALNDVLGAMPFDVANKFLELWEFRRQERVEIAINNGTYDTGIEEISGTSLRIPDGGERVVFNAPDGTQARIVQIEVRTKLEPMTGAELKALLAGYDIKQRLFVRNRSTKRPGIMFEDNSGNKYVIEPTPHRTVARGKSTWHNHRLFTIGMDINWETRPGNGRYIPFDSFEELVLNRDTLGDYDSAIKAWLLENGVNTAEQLDYITSTRLLEGHLLTEDKNNPDKNIIESIDAMLKGIYGAEYQPISEIKQAERPTSNGRLDFDAIDKAANTKKGAEAWNRYRNEWLKDTGGWATDVVHMITGNVLSIWDRIDGAAKSSLIRKAVLDKQDWEDQPRILVGRVFPEGSDEELRNTLRNLGAGEAQYNAAQLAEMLGKGATLVLSNSAQIRNGALPHRTDPTKSWSGVYVVSADVEGRFERFGIKTLHEFQALGAERKRGLDAGLFQPKELAATLNKVLKRYPLAEIVWPAGTSGMDFGDTADAGTATPADPDPVTEFEAFLKKRGLEFSEASIAQLRSANVWDADKYRNPVFLRGETKKYKDLIKASADPHAWVGIHTSWAVESEHLPKIAQAIKASEESSGNKPAFSLRSGDLSGAFGMPAETVTAKVEGLREGFYGTATDVRVLQSEADLPAHVLASRPEGAKVEAAFDPASGSIWVVADNIQSLEHLQAVLTEEIFGHYGTRALLGKGFRPFLRDVWRKYRNDPRMAEIVELYGLDPADMADQLVAADEMLAKLARDVPADAKAGKDATILKRMVRAIRRFASKLPVIGKYFSALTDAEVQQVLVKARTAARNGSGPSPEQVADILYSAAPRTLYAHKGNILMAAAAADAHGQWTVYFATGNTLLSGGYRRETFANAKLARKAMEGVGYDVSPHRNKYGPKPQHAPMFNNFSVPVEGRKDLLLRKVQDKFRRLYTVQRSIAAQGGKLDIETDAYRAEERMHGLQFEAVRAFEEKFVEPLIKLMGEQKITLEELGQYAYARHAPERNKKMAERNPELADTLAAKGLQLSGMTDAEAKQIMDDAAATGRAGVLEQAAALVDAILSHQLDVMESEGLETAATVKMLREQYKHYVPLRGKSPDMDAYEGQIGVGFGLPSGLSVRGKEFRVAYGRASRASDIVLTAITQTERTLVRAERVRPARAFLKFVQANPDPALWEINAPEFKPYFNEDGEVEYAPAGGHPKDAMVVPVAGKRHHIIIKDPILRKAMLGITDPERVGLVIRSIGGITRTLAALNTSFNVEFGVVNFVRDVQTALVHVQDENLLSMYAMTDAQRKGISPEVDKLARRVLMDIGGALKGSFQALRGHDRNKMSAKSREWAEWFDKYRQSGGKIEFYSLKNLDQKRKQLESSLRRASGVGVWGDLKGGFKWGIDLISDYNSAIENSARLATFRRLVEAGTPTEVAASVARNLTVNFNRKGEIGNIFNALYMFFNATVQGSYRMLSHVSKSKKMQRFMVGAIVASATWAFIARLLMGRDDEDGRYFYDDDIPDWVKDHNIVLPALWSQGQGDYIKIPLPYGYNVINTLGNMIAGVASGAYQPKDYPRLAVRFAVSVIDAFNPMGETGNLAQLIAPTVLDPFVQIETNRNFFGAPLRPEAPSWAKYETPDSQLYWSSASPISKSVAKRLNELTGGHEYRPGWLDISPSTMDHFLEFMAGGAGATIWRGVSSSVNLLSGEEVAVRKVPFARRLIGQASEYRPTETYRSNLAEVEGARRMLDDVRKAGDKAKIQAIIADEGFRLTLVPAMKATERELKKLFQQRRQVNESRLPERAKKERVEQINRRITMLQKAFNKRFDEAQEAAE